MKEAGTFRVCYATLTTVDFLPRALILRDSIKRCANKDLHILLVDHPNNASEISSQISYRLISLDEIGCPQWPHMSFYYNKFEFSCSLKSFLILHCLRKLQYDAVLFFDSDMEIYSTTNELESLIEHNEILITPHIERPLPEDGLSPSNYVIIVAGQFNAGFLGFRNTKNNLAILDWLSSRMEENCLQNEIMNADQFWTNLVVSFSDGIHILRSPRYNFSYWNMLHRKLWLDENGIFQTKDGPLVFFHYSGFGAQRPEKIEYASVHQNRTILSDKDPLVTLLKEYRKKIVDSRYGAYNARRYDFNYYTDGSEISEYHRKTFLNLDKRERNSLGNPFAERKEIERCFRNRKTEVFRKYFSRQNALYLLLPGTQYELSQAELVLLRGVARITLVISNTIKKVPFLRSIASRTILAMRTTYKYFNNTKRISDSHDK
jgi:hypothetical protein